jgi:hypothetical protein
MVIYWVFIVNVTARAFNGWYLVFVLPFAAGLGWILYDWAMED